MSKPFNTSIEDGIAELIFNHPPVNAFTSDGWAAIAQEIEDLGQNPAVRVIIIAAGRLLTLGCANDHPSFIVSCSFSNQVLTQFDLEE